MDLAKLDTYAKGRMKGVKKSVTFLKTTRPNYRIKRVSLMGFDDMDELISVLVLAGAKRKGPTGQMVVHKYRARMALVNRTGVNVIMVWELLCNDGKRWKP